jgi:hypothetical protein
MAPGFDRDIRPLFRDKDISAMRRFFDLTSYADVSQFAAEILERLEAGSMPCDLMWTQEQVSAFRRWLDSGMPP